MLNNDHCITFFLRKKMKITLAKVRVLLTNIENVQSNTINAAMSC